jgi:hypothetical protein
LPHIVFDKKINLVEFSNKFQTIMKKESGIIKILDVFVNKNRDRSLVTALVIDDLHQEFIIELDVKEDTSTLRLFPMTDPEKKTDGVKAAMGLVALYAMMVSPDARIIRTNIESFIPKRVIDVKKVSV